MAHQKDPRRGRRHPYNKLLCRHRRAPPLPASRLCTAAAGAGGAAAAGTHRHPGPTRRKVEALFVGDLGEGGVGVHPTRQVWNQRRQRVPLPKFLLHGLLEDEGSDGCLQLVHLRGGGEAGRHQAERGVSRPLPAASAQRRERQGRRDVAGAAPRGATCQPRPPPGPSKSSSTLKTNTCRHNHHHQQRATTHTANPAHLLPIQPPQDLSFQKASQPLVEPQVLPVGVGDQVACRRQEAGGRAAGQRGSVRRTARHGMAQHSTAQRGTARHSKAQRSMASTAQRGIAWRSVAQRSAAHPSSCVLSRGPRSWSSICLRPAGRGSQR